MNDNLYFLFLDEIYDPNLNSFRRLSKQEIFSHSNHLHFGMSSVYVPASCLNGLYLKSNKIKTKYYQESKGLIFHYIDILNTRDKFSDLAKNNKKSQSFRDSINNFLAQAEFKFNCIFVDKHELIKNFGKFGPDNKVAKIKKIGSNLFPQSPFVNYNLYLLCLRQILIDFYAFLSDKNNSARGMVIAEARGEREDTELREAFNKIYYHGVGKITANKLRNIILDLFIVPKKQNYIGTQLADLVLYPTYDARVPMHGKRTDHFINFEKNLRKKLKKEVMIIPQETKQGLAASSANGITPFPDKIIKHKEKNVK